MSICTGSVVDPDPYWIRIQELPGSGSVFGNTDPDPNMQIYHKLEAKDVRFKI